MSLILLAGGIASGKSSLASALAERLGAEVVSVRRALIDIVGSPTDRVSLQREGAALDARTNGEWLADYLETRCTSGTHLIVDSVRTLKQTLPILSRFDSAVLIYLDASESTRFERFESAKSKDPLKRTVSLEDAMLHPTEVGVRALRPFAALVLATDDRDVESVAADVIATLQSE